MRDIFAHDDLRERIDVAACGLGNNDKLAARGERPE